MLESKLDGVFREAVAPSFMSSANAVSAPVKSMFQIGEEFVNRIRDSIVPSDLVGTTKEKFLSIVDGLYDKFVLPLDLPGPDAFLDPLLKDLVRAACGRLYDSLIAQLS